MTAQKASTSKTLPLMAAGLLWFWPGSGSAQEETETPPIGGDSEAKPKTETKDEPVEEDKKSDRDSLADRIKSVQRKVFLKRERIEVFPYFGLDLNDPFRQHFIVGGSVAYHLVDSFSVEARGGFVFASIDQKVIDVVRRTEGATPLDPPGFKYHLDLDATWAPIYGKLALFGDAILHFDTYLSVGPIGVFGTDEGLNYAANVGIGQRYFITSWLTARAELRNYIFVEDRNGVSQAENLMVLGFSVSGFFPTSFEYEFQ